MPVAEIVLLDEGQDLAHAPGGQLAQVVEVDLHVEVARVGQHRTVLHALEVLRAQHGPRSRHGHEQVAALGGLE